MIKECRYDAGCLPADVSTNMALCVGCGGFQPLGPSTDYESLDRQEKQIAYELWAAAQRYETKPERRLRRNRMATKWVLRHSQIRAAAKKRGVPKKGNPVPKLSSRRERQLERQASQLIRVQVNNANFGFDSVEKAVA